MPHLNIKSPVAATASVMKSNQTSLSKPKESAGHSSVASSKKNAAIFVRQSANTDRGVLLPPPI